MFGFLEGVMRSGGPLNLLSAGILIVFLTCAGQLWSQKTTSRKPPQSSAGPRAQDREGIGDLQKHEITATMAMDVSNLLDLWTDDGVLLPPHHSPVVGKAALRSFLQEGKDKYGNYDMLAYNEEWSEVVVTGDYAYQWGTVTYRLKPPTGDEMAGAVHVIRVLKHEEDAWRVSRAIWNEALVSAQ